MQKNRPSLADFGLYKVKELKNTFGLVKYAIIACALLLVLIFAYGCVKYYKRDKTVPPSEEKLVASGTMNRDEIAPHPFIPLLIGEPPRQFSSTPRPATTNYPQLTQYRNRYYPKSIQDIIGYVTPKTPIKTQKRQREKQSSASNQENFTFSTPDPFSLYKPQDPSDINLLATASFRFAPPIWSAPRTKPNKKVLFQGQQPQADSPDIQETFNRLSKRPMVITLNIYPMDGGEQLQRYGQYPYPYRFDPRVRTMNRMTVHLNLVPEIEGEAKNVVN